MHQAKRNVWDGPVPKEPRSYARIGKLAAPQQSLPTGFVSWYHLLDGQRHVIDLVTQWTGDVDRLRRKVYYEAYSRLLKVKTEQTSYRTLAITAFNPWPPGSKYHVLAQDQLERAIQQDPTPEPHTVVDTYDADQDERDNCTCGTTDRRHLPSCRVWG